MSKRPPPSKNQSFVSDFPHLLKEWDFKKIKNNQMKYEEAVKKNIFGFAQKNIRTPQQHCIEPPLIADVQFVPGVLLRKRIA